jgi:hypothetical protein
MAIMLYVSRKTFLDPHGARFGIALKSFTFRGCLVSSFALLAVRSFRAA